MRRVFKFVLAAAVLALLIIGAFLYRRFQIEMASCGITCDLPRIEHFAEIYRVKHDIKRGETLSFTQLVDDGWIKKQSRMAKGETHHGDPYPPELNYHAYFKHINPYRNLDVPMEYRELFAPVVPLDSSQWGAYPPAVHGPPVTNAFLLAVRDNKLEEVDALLAGGADVNTRDINGWTALMYSCFAGSGGTDMVRKLLAKGAEVSALDEDGFTALMHSVMDNRGDAAVLLLDAGAARNDKSRAGCSVLHMAVDKGNELMVEMLIAAGVDVNIKNEEGKTPLMFALGEIRSGPVMRALLKGGADPNIRGPEGNTALIMSLCYTQEYAANIARILLENGADPMIRNDDGRNAYDVTNRQPGLKKLLYGLKKDAKAL